jgi:hypothetical protein
MRLAGTWSKYSNRAMPQLTRAATYQAWRFRLRRWPYHANVMNMLEAISSKTVLTNTDLAIAVKSTANLLGMLIGWMVD